MSDEPRPPPIPTQPCFRCGGLTNETQSVYGVGHYWCLREMGDKPVTWDDYFMGIAETTANKSKDPSTRVGAVLVDEDNRVISTGYNGLPRGVPDDLKLLNDRGVKLALTIHAEQNALLFAGRSVKGATCYVWPMPPCAQCAAKLVQAGVKRIVAPEPTPEQYDRWGKDLALAEWLYLHSETTLSIYTGEMG